MTTIKLSTVPKSQPITALQGQIRGFCTTKEAHKALKEPHLNTVTAVGRLMLNVTGAMAQFERDQIRERTKRGMEEKQRQGMFIGRRALFDDKQAAQIKRDRKTMTAAEVAEKWNCSAGTIDKYAKA